MGFIRVDRVELAQPPFVTLRPAVQILCGTFWKGILAQRIAQSVEVILQFGDQFRLRYRAQIRLYKGLLQKAGNQRGVVGTQ